SPRAVTKTAEFLGIGDLEQRWRVKRPVVHRLRKEDPAFPKPVIGEFNIFALADVERFEKTRTFEPRLNMLIAAIEHELKSVIDEATWVKAISTAKKKVPGWGKKNT